MVQCAKDPVPIGVGYLAQYIVKPLLGYGIAKVLSQSLQPKVWLLTSDSFSKHACHLAEELLHCNHQFDT